MIALFNFCACFAEEIPAESFGKILKNHIIDSVCEGDLKNDGGKEYAVFSHVKGTEALDGGKDTVRYYYDLSIFEKRGGDLALLWTDKGKLGYYQGFLSPQNSMLGIGDILNNGKQYLVIRFDEDDSYDLLSWQEDKMVIAKEMSLFDGKVFNEAIKKPGNEIMTGEFSLIKEGSGTKLKVLISNMEEKVIKIIGNKYTVERDGVPVN